MNKLYTIYKDKIVELKPKEDFTIGGSKFYIWSAENMGRNQVYYGFYDNSKAANSYSKLDTEWSSPKTFGFSNAASIKEVRRSLMIQSGTIESRIEIKNNKSKKRAPMYGGYRDYGGGWDHPMSMMMEEEMFYMMEEMAMEKWHNNDMVKSLQEKFQVIGGPYAHNLTLVELTPTVRLEVYNDLRKAEEGLEKKIVDNIKKYETQLKKMKIDSKPLYLFDPKNDTNESDNVKYGKIKWFKAEVVEKSPENPSGVTKVIKVKMPTNGFGWSRNGFRNGTYFGSITGISNGDITKVSGTAHILEVKIGKKKYSRDEFGFYSKSIKGKLNPGIKVYK